MKRRGNVLTAFAVLSCFGSASLSPRSASGEQSPPSDGVLERPERSLLAPSDPAVEAIRESRIPDDFSVDGKFEWPDPSTLAPEDRATFDADFAVPEDLAANGSGSLKPAALPTGVDPGSVSAKSISVPKGSGSIEGMGESFSAQLSTGIATFSLPFSLPAARGAAQPSLALSYSSAAGQGIAGLGWDLGVASIARKMDQGLPRYEDQSGWHAGQDQFVFAGDELVPICTVGNAGECDGALSFVQENTCEEPADEQAVQEAMPAWAAGWQYFRARIEGAFLRFFWSPDHLTWRVQAKSGVTFELGVPLDGSGDRGALEENPDQPGQVARWHIARQYDAYGDANPAIGNPEPVNVVVYKYLQDGGRAYLSDIFDTSPAADPTTGDLTRFAHHTHLAYEDRSDPTFSYRSGWRIDQRLRLGRVDVTSKSFNGGAAAARRLLRRYHLAYLAGSHASLLESVQIEGRCEGSEDDAPAEDDAQTLGVTNCPRLPALRLGYAEAAELVSGGALAGYPALRESVRSIASSPPHSLDEAQADLFDLNADALPDVLVTMPGRYGSGHGAFLNGQGGALDAFGAVRHVPVQPVLGATVNDITLKNPNVAPLDLDGDGRVEFLHMRQAGTYGVYDASLEGLIGRVVTLASGTSPQIDLGRDAAQTKITDANFDGLLDLVVSTGTELKTFFSLGRHPGGDGQLGLAFSIDRGPASISTDPARSCLPSSGLPVQLDDREMRLADMNGDGIPDIVRAQRGNVRYWPGRGNGFWGTGQLDDCPAGTFGIDRHLTMSQSPNYSDLSALHLDDVNGDGLADLVQVKFSEVDVWLNVDGVGWTDRHILRDVPQSPSFASRVRLVDLNGSGTTDIVWGSASGYRYVDLAQPILLTSIDNGLGKTTAVEYTTSTAEMLAAEQSGVGCENGSAWDRAWCSKMPIVAHVVKRVTESDNLSIGPRTPAPNVTEYGYRDAVYDGREREFRGFRQVRVRRVGDADSATDLTETRFLLGECSDENLGDEVDPCASAAGENPREALKGLPTLVEHFDETGKYLSTEHTGYRLRRLYMGLDGQEVRHAFVSETTEFRYDTTPFTASQGTRELVSVALELELGEVTESLSTVVPVRSSAGTAEIQTSFEIDPLGNPSRAVAQGCTGGGACPTPDEVITTHTASNLPEEDATGWLWRTVESCVTGSAHTAAGGAPVTRKRTFTSYNPQGAPLGTSVALWGSLPLLRSHATPGSDVAPAPADASSDGVIELSAIDYDGFGNPTRETGPNGRCREMSYEGSLDRPAGEPITGYDHLPTLEVVYTGGCGQGGLSTVAGYDRGLAKVTLVTDVTFQRTKIEYDGFGRFRALTKPDPADPEELSCMPSLEVEYFLPGDLAVDGAPARYSAIHSRTQDGNALCTDSYMESWTYVDGYGRPALTLGEAQPSACDQEANWIASEFVEYDAKGALRRKYAPEFFNVADPKHFDGTPAKVMLSQRYEAFGRVVQTYKYSALKLQNRYHALATEALDALQLQRDLPVTKRVDGHGRTTTASQRARPGGTGAAEELQIRTTYLPTGEPEVIARVRCDDSEAPGAPCTPLETPVVRWMRYDSLGRMVLNVEPNTTANFTSDPAASATGLLAWRYAHNDAGDLVGTSDARGCGANYGYDAAGRILTEDYSPCESHQPAYTEPDLDDPNGPAGVEVLNHYDSAPSEPYSGLERPPCLDVANQNFFRGRLAATFDRGSASWQSYDGRGRVTEQAIHAARPGPSVALIPDRYAPRSYCKDYTFDAADREVRHTTGAASSELLGAGAKSEVTTSYSASGEVQGASGSYDHLVTIYCRAADGLPSYVIYGQEAAPSTSLQYDDQRRLQSVGTGRSAPLSWSSPPPNYLPPPNPGGPPNTFQELLQSEGVTYDLADNPIEIRDYRNPTEWPAGAKPVTREMKYDDLYRVTEVEYSYTGGTDSWTSPFAAENSADPDLQDSRRGAPSPQVAFSNRMLLQTFAYDWLGNTTHTGDDASGFYDRSLGEITNGSAAAGPYQLQSAESDGTPGPRDGALATQYDPAGNLIRMNVERNGSCLPAGAECSMRYAYDWDEVGRLVRARRWDVPAASLGTPESALPSADPDADLTYLYNSSDERTLKTATAPGGDARHAVYIFDSLELRGSSFEDGDYVRDASTEVAHLIANGQRLARLVYAEPEVPSIGAARLHVFLELDDHLGSTNVVIDKATGELVERTTYQAYGGTESDYRPVRWQAFREDYRFTGKEEDVEVGLQYFGKRFYAPRLGRWMSADPLPLHAPTEADPNLYAYVSGTVFKATDPLGLDASLTADEMIELEIRRDGLIHAAKTKMPDVAQRLEQFRDKIYIDDRPVAENESQHRVDFNSKKGTVTLRSTAFKSQSTLLSTLVAADTLLDQMHSGRFGEEGRNKINELESYKKEFLNAHRTGIDEEGIRKIKEKIRKIAGHTERSDDKDDSPQKISSTELDRAASGDFTPDETTSRPKGYKPPPPVPQATDNEDPTR